ncbi:type I restriction modification DNA specificity domain protein [Yersinia pseudotuberculosis IP 32953]|uniref:Possible restriction modification enzyme n=1 Tax=Yersinia pseudotuberculosis serotype I (strain IP32953) TaxID=273123 RepID=Q663Z3_YERPS|nr:restriction endonuclease subunit S [Yersinia pseudotuberculosis]CQD58764.1 restriction modification enzyme [Yersinia intermedia]AJJ03951.1 type I restriction modification DNA specificity domain protein [Yersinia pseudotuberculosis]AJJ57051.1 type I restriction modification DNA specificity domain protein [Yersinia pseudotuberculosis IP 32953]AJJ66956.1 type I restriction modification DNA specificity domain protein [Yersinia pseudotuberculosis PB1/+]AJJ70767.1 type I restriction modification 
MVPEGWKLSTFGNHVDCLTGFAFKSKSYSNNPEDIRLLRGDNIEPSRLRWRDAKFWPAQEYEKLEKFQLRKGDFVIAMDRTWVSSGLKVAEVQHTDIPCLLVQRVARIRARSTLEQSLLRQYFSDNKFEQYVKSVQTATAVPHISPNDIKDFTFLLPPINEQKKIARILSTWDKAIATTEQLLANSQLQKKALMQQLLTGKKRFPGFSEEWTEVHLSDLCFINPSRSEKPENGVVSFISMDGVSEDAKLIKTEDRYYSDVSKGFTSFKDDDVLVAKITPCFENGKGAYVINLTNGIGFGSTEFHVLRAKEGVNAKYIYYLTVMTEFRVRGEMNMQGSAGQKRVTTDYLKSLKLTVPISFTEQNKIATVLTVSDQEIATLKQKLNHLKQEKKALMQQLLTGKRRVKVDAA